MIYDKAKGLGVKWTIEDFIGHYNIHEDQHSYLPVFEFTKMSSNRINFIKNFYEVFPGSEIIARVKVFNASMRPESNCLEKSTKQSK